MRFPLLRKALMAAAVASGVVGAAPERGTPVPTVLDATSETGGGTSIVTLSDITPVANRLVTLIVAHAGATPTQPTVTGCGLTWVAEESKTTVAGTRRMTIFRAFGASPTTGKLTFNFGADSQTSCAWQVVQWAGADTSGTDGSGAVRQSPAGTSTASGTSLAAPTLAALEYAGNANFSCFMLDTNASVTPDADFAELADDGETNQTITLECQWALNQVDCTATFSTAGAAALSVEIKAA